MLLLMICVSIKIVSLPLKLLNDYSVFAGLREGNVSCPTACTLPPTSGMWA